MHDDSGKEKGSGRGRRWRLLVAAALVALSAGGLLVAAGPAGASEPCRTISGGQVGWFVQFMDTDGRQNVAVWRSQIRRTSDCDILGIDNRGFVNTSADTARVRTRTYYENGDLRVDSGWETVPVRTAILRVHVDAGRLVRFDVHAAAGVDSASRPPAGETRLFL
jgi:hypothetical protein